MTINKESIFVHKLRNIFTMLTNQYAYKTLTISQIVVAARKGVIHTSLMTPQGIASERKLNIPMATRPTELYELQK